MSRINIANLNIVGSVIIPANTEATAPSGYAFVMLTPATATGLTFQTLFTPITGAIVNDDGVEVFVPETSFVGSNTGATGPVGAGVLASTTNLEATMSRPIYGRYTKVKPSQVYAAFAYIGR